MIGYVYKIESDCKEVLYIGSTIQKLKQRFNEHKKKNQRTIISKYLNLPNYKFSNGCELLKEYEIVDKKHLLAYEQLWMNRTKNINRQNTFKFVFKNIIKEYQKKYHEANKEKRKEYKKEYYEANKENIKQKKKEYYEANKEKLKQKKKEWYERTKIINGLINDLVDSVVQLASVE